MNDQFSDAGRSRPAWVSADHGLPLPPLAGPVPADRVRDGKWWTGYGPDCRPATCRSPTPSRLCLAPAPARRAAAAAAATRRLVAALVAGRAARARRSRRRDAAGRGDGPPSWGRPCCCRCISVEPYFTFTGIAPLIWITAAFAIGGKPAPRPEWATPARRRGRWPRRPRARRAPSLGSDEWTTKRLPPPWKACPSCRPPRDGSCTTTCAARGPRRCWSWAPPMACRAPTSRRRWTRTAAARSPPWSRRPSASRTPRPRSCSSASACRDIATRGPQRQHRTPGSSRSRWRRAPTPPATASRAYDFCYLDGSKDLDHVDGAGRGARSRSCCAPAAGC